MFLIYTVVIRYVSAAFCILIGNELIYDRPVIWLAVIVELVNSILCSYLWKIQVYFQESK